MCAKMTVFIPPSPPSPPNLTSLHTFMTAITFQFYNFEKSVRHEQPLLFNFNINKYVTNLGSNWCCSGISRRITLTLSKSDHTVKYEVCKVAVFILDPPIYTEAYYLIHNRRKFSHINITAVSDLIHADLQ